MHQMLNSFAKMGANVHSLGPKLASGLLQKTLFMFHTFLPYQYGDVVGSLSQMGFTSSDMSTEDSNRLIAVITRVFVKMHVIDAVQTLCSLQTMGFTWRDLSINKKSIAQGNAVAPLVEIIEKYLKTRVSSMKEREFALVMFALGNFGASWNDLPDVVQNKINHRITRVAHYLSTRSTSDALCGMGKMGVVWNALPQASKKSWEDALLSDFVPTSPVYLGEGGEGNTININSNNDLDAKEIDNEGLEDLESLDSQQNMSPDAHSSHSSDVLMSSRTESNHIQTIAISQSQSQSQNNGGTNSPTQDEGKLVDVNDDNITSQTSAPPLKSNKIDYKRGLIGMDAAELSKAVYGMGLMGVDYATLSSQTQQVLTQRIADQVSRMTDEDKILCLQGLKNMKFPLNNIW